MTPNKNQMSDNIEVNPAGIPKRLPTFPEHVCDFTGVTGRGGAVQMWVPIEPGYSSFVMRKKNPAFVKVSFVCESSSWVLDMPGNRVFAPVEILADGAIFTRLFAEDRSYHAAPDAMISLHDGTTKREFHMGNAMHVQANNEGLIWAGYSDEGIYTTPSIGTSGLVCFDADGRVHWEFKPPAGFDPISECYVLNCAEDAVWACYYTDFPIVRIDSEFQIRAWHTDLSGPSQMAVIGDRVLVYGGYGDHANDCWLLKLGESNAERIAKVQLCLPGNASLDKAVIIGRGRFLNVFAGDLWYRFEVPRD